MLKITKRASIKPQKSTTRYVLQYQNEQLIQKLITSSPTQTQPLNLESIAKIYQQQTSINSQTLAQILQKVTASSDEHNHTQNTMFILKLIKLSHDQRQLRYFLKNKYKIDSNLLLLLLWSHRQNQLAVYLVNIILDAYTVQLMLNGGEALALWREYIRNKLVCVRSREELMAQIGVLASGKEGKGKKNNGDQFRNVIIPL